MKTPTQESTRKNLIVKPISFDTIVRGFTQAARMKFGKNKYALEYPKEDDVEITMKRRSSST